MKTYDWIVVGGGITGSALSYELAKKGFKVLLLEKDLVSNNATLYSYGGLAYWSGTNELTRKLCQEGIEIHRNLSAELAADTEFREIDLVLTINNTENPQIIAENYSHFAIKPELLDVKQACEIEPLLNPNAISGVLKLPHGHINTQKTNEAYQQAFIRLGGEMQIDTVVQLLRQGNKITGVTTQNQNYYAKNTVICAGGLSRSLLKEARINVKLYFTHAQLIKTVPTDIKLRTLVMPAAQKRFLLEAKASQPDVELLWDRPSENDVFTILDPGAIQFLDGSLYLGQISQIVTNPYAVIDPFASETKIRAGVASLLPLIGIIPGTWHNCLVAFANNPFSLIGKIDYFEGVYLFSGFTSTLVFAPPLARHFASWMAGENDVILPQLSSLN